MKTLLQATIINGYRTKRKWYDIFKGHTGEDYDYVYEGLPSPVTGKVVQIATGKEMGQCLYIEDVEGGNIHVFAHLSQIKKGIGDHVARNEIVAITGNTGSASSGPHLHYEIITFKAINPIDKLMTRKLSIFKGFNTKPSEYLKSIYKKYDIPDNGVKTVQVAIEKPTGTPEKRASVIARLARRFSKANS